MKRHAIFVSQAAAAFLLVAGCDRPIELPRGSEDQPQKEVSTPREENADKGEGKADKARQAAFLNRIRAADPDKQTIERALINENNELGLILDRSVQMDDIPKLMRSMLGEMAKEFPDQDLTIIAYAPSNPPRRIGTARLNPRTRDMTYTPEK